MPKTMDKRNIESKLKYTHMKVRASNGQMMECIEYINSRNLTVKFEDDTVLHNVYRCSFLKGNVQNPNNKCTNQNKAKIEKAKEKYIGMEIRAKNGLMMKCIDYIDANNITVRFENNNIRTNVGCTEFLKGLVRENKAQKYMEMVVTATNGQTMRCVEYFGTRNITVQFDDDTIVYNQSVAAFVRGMVRNPNRPHPLLKKEERKDKQFILNNVQTATVIKYESADDVIVKLSDNSIVKTNWWALEHGISIGSKPSARAEHIHEQYQSQYGIMCEITGVNKQSYQITWEDGYTSNTEKKALLNKVSRHPILKKDKKVSFNYNGYIAKFIYNTDTDCYYACKCPKCGLDDILSAKEMLIRHTCELAD